MTEYDLRAILKDWMTEIGLTITERADATTKLRSQVTAQSYDAYDRAMTFAEKRLGLTLPTTIDDHDLLLEYASKLWLCNRIIAREVGGFDIDDKKLSKIFSNVKEQRTVLNAEFQELRTEIWGAGKRNARTTTGALEIAVMSTVSAHQTDIDNEDVLELDS